VTRRAATSLLALLAVACGAASAQEGGAKKPAPPRLLLVTLDTTRADRLGCYGAKEARTPGIDALAARGVLYEQAWCTAPITLSSHLTILSGVLPASHGVRDNGGFEVAPGAKLLSEALKEQGFETAAFVGSYVLDARSGMNQGFDVYDGADVAKLGSVWGVVERPAGAVVDAALRWVEKLGADERFFAWVHFYDAHYPYQPPPGLATDADHAYEGEIAYCDRELRRLLDRLHARGLDDGLVVAVTADHGESLGEHGEKTHGIFVYDATMHVPLVIAPPPAGVAPGSRIRAPVSTVEIAATLLERLGVGRGALPDSRAAPLPVADSDGDDERALYLESFTPFYSHGMRPLRALVWKGTKYVESVRPELYSLRDDPRETRDLWPQKGGDVGERMRQRLAALLAENPPLPWNGEHEVSAEEAANLQRLGYAGGRLTGDPLAMSDLVDAKDHIGDLDLMDRLVSLTRDGSALTGQDAISNPELTKDQLDHRHKEGRAMLLEARRLLEQLRDGNPRDPMILVMEGSIAIGLAEWDAAVPALEKLVEGTPRNPTNHYNLSNAYAKSGRLDWAKRELEKSAWLEPRSLHAPRALVEFARKEKDWPAVAWWLDALAQCPGISAAELDQVRQRRIAVQERLNATAAAPRAPKPVTDADLKPEGSK
jgi:arylsulfatase A-like enzyme